MGRFPGVNSLQPVLRSVYLSVLPAIVIAVFTSCNKKIDKIPNSEILSLPSITVKNFRSIYSDSGKVQLILRSPLMEEYQKKDEPYMEFSDGILVTYFEGKKDSIGYVAAKYARYDEKTKLWELKDSVVVVNETNDKLETEQLFWDQEKDRIFTDISVKITNEDQTVIGSGFESDSKLTTRVIKNVTATIYLKDE
jgi:LPS export ABC transporter protein LptC